MTQTRPRLNNWIYNYTYPLQFVENWPQPFWMRLFLMHTVR